MFLHSDINEIKLTNAVPQTESELRKLRELISQFLEEKTLVPPLQQGDILNLSAQFIILHPEYAQYQKLVAVLINNKTWEPIVRSIPFNRRILLLPQCFRHSTECSANVDELGLLCKSCGLCKIDEFTKKAEQKGYHIIVSEGTGAVSLLLASGQVECVVGVGCLDSLEKSFPLAMNHAIPSIAIPLFNSDCKDSKVDETWLHSTIEMNGEARWNGWINLESTLKKIESWFAVDNLIKLFKCTEETGLIANRWLEAGGKRWRPLIMVSIYKAIAGENINEDAAMKLAVAVECFHKASLVHDDIADKDTERYGQETLHEKYDVSIALNIGDLLMGYGYQLIADAGISPQHISKLLSVASSGHKDLCIGQGQELIVRKSNNVLPVDDIIEIFSNKTSPAFEVALKFGAVVSNASEQLLKIIEEYSKALGIAYQIKDDLDDFNQESSTNDINAFRPSLVLALLGDNYPEKMNHFIQRHKQGDTEVAFDLYKWAKETDVVDQAYQMMVDYRQKALDVLSHIQIPEVKVLLFRLVNRIIGIPKD